MQPVSQPTTAKDRRRHLHALTRRANYLREVLMADEPGSKRPGRAYDVAELSALKAALELLSVHYGRAALEDD